MTTSAAPRSTTIHHVLSSLREAAMDERHKGDLFESLMASYLRTDPVYRTRFSDVWLWMDWPDRDGKPDTGIDLVARERETGGLCAIQCKFYAEGHHLQKSDLDSFFTASGKAGFTTRMVISTTDSWSTHAEAALENQQIPVSRLRVQDLAESSIDWSQFVIERPGEMTLRERKALFPHQKVAVDKVLAGLREADRGKLIMACGTGKTFTSLKLAEGQVPVGGTVLFLVPSISLLSQTLREWSSEAEVPIRPFAVCSDPRAGRRTTSEDIGPYDLAFPASTDTTKLVGRFLGPGRDDAINVVFSTYQSLQVVADAQAAGLPRFDLVICDEAHRTTGVTLANEDESNFVRIHDADYISADKRLYMTATPRIYDDASKRKADEGSAIVASMDNPDFFGEEFHRLGFGEAVSNGLLTDYKVLVLAVDEAMVASTFQRQLSEDGELKLEDAAKIVGCWNGLSKRGFDPDHLKADPAPMRRAVAFAQDIKTSKRIADLFPEVTEVIVEKDSDGGALHCEAEHVDGTFNVLLRNEKLDWLKEDTGAEQNVCRILSNARCLSEGVDVPALDAVLFLNPRNSQVDVVQSVGRVMRLAKGKDYGYVILPIGVPAGVKAEDALNDNKRYKVVWQVLQALRSHDDRFNALVNKIDLNKDPGGKIQVIGVGAGGPGGGDGDDDDSGPTAKPIQLAMSMNVDEWKDAIFAKIVKKVGQRTYWEDWAKDVADIAARQRTRIIAILDNPELDVDDEFDKFLTGLRGNLNDNISRDDAVDMLCQHLITKPVFDALFEDYSFAAQNPVSLVMESMLATLHEHHLDSEAESLDTFYESVRMRAAGIDNAAGKQRIITELYERFFAIAFKKTAESLGIVYTPIPVVDFILRSVEHLLKSEFGVSISDPGVHVLDPFTGTGTFVVRLLESGLIQPEDLLRKYTSELHANEILLLAYYIAAINIEATFHGLVAHGEAGAGAYKPFTGIVLTDTFQMTEIDDSMDEKIFPINNERAEHQKSLDIRVVLGNPPYSVGQTSQNDGNANLNYPTLDRAIERTYAAKSTAGLKRNLYDSYVRAFRWASDRVGDAGIVAFVTNGSYIDNLSSDGFRKCLVEEFTDVYCLNLRGNQKTTQGEASKREGGKVFGSGSRTPVAITVLVKKLGSTSRGTIKYADIGDYQSRESKLESVTRFASVDGVAWTDITPSDSGDWINQRDPRYDIYLSLTAKEKGEAAVFVQPSYGVLTNRDPWVYSFGKGSLLAGVESMVARFNQLADDFPTALSERSELSKNQVIEQHIDRDPTRISWSRGLKTRLGRQSPHIEVDTDNIRVSAYRPYCKQFLYFSRDLNEGVSQQPHLFPTASTENKVIVVTGVGIQKDFSALMVDALPNLHVQDTGLCFARWRYVPTSRPQMDGQVSLNSSDADDGYERVENISDDTLEAFRRRYSDDAITKDGIFDYVYGLLHHPEYRARYSSELRKAVPRVPFGADFHGVRAAGAELATLHLQYETVDPYPLREVVTGTADDDDLYRVKKMRIVEGGTCVVVNDNVRLEGIPDVTYEYVCSGRPALEWVVDRYQVRTDKDSRRVNDPNDWSEDHDDPRYIVDLVKRVVQVSVETQRIVTDMPSLKLEA